MGKKSELCIVLHCPPSFLNLPSKLLPHWSPCQPLCPPLYSPAPRRHCKFTLSRQRCHGLAVQPKELDPSGDFARPLTCSEAIGESSISQPHPHTSQALPPKSTGCTVTMESLLLSVNPDSSCPPTGRHPHHPHPSNELCPMTTPYTR